MGFSASAIHVRGVSANDVADALRGLVQERALVSPGSAGWITVYDATAERHFDEGKLLSSRISKKLKTVVVLLDLYDEAVTRYAVFDAGKKIDEFNSCPDYFQPTTTPRGGNPRLLLRYGGLGKDLDSYRAVLGAHDPSSLVEEERLRDLARAFGIAPSRVASGYSSVSSSSKAKAMLAVHAAADAAAAAALVAAARKGDESQVRELLNGGVPADATDGEGATALQRAVEGGHLAVLRLLLKQRAAKASLSGALLWAAVRQDVPAARALLVAGANPNETDDRGATPLFRAVYHPKSDPRMARLLLRAGARPSRRLTVQQLGAAARATTALHAAATVAPVEVVQVLASVVKTKDVKDAAGKTPLMIATERGRADVVAALTRRGTRPK